MAATAMNHEGSLEPTNVSISKARPEVELGLGVGVHIVMRLRPPAIDDEDGMGGMDE